MPRDGIPSLPGGLAADSRVPVGGRFQLLARSATQGDDTALAKEHDLFRHVVCHDAL